MGKGTDKLYITHSEWSSEDAFSASKGSSASKAKIPGANFRRLPFNFCAVSLQPFKQPVCTSDGVIFDWENILEWLKKHGTNPINGTPLKSADLIKLNFMKNDDGEFVDPVTYRVLTDNSHIVALGNTGNVFTWDTIDRLNIKAKNWKDLVSEEDFTRKDLITLQDPQNLGARDLSSFKYVQEGVRTLTDAQEAERSSGVNADALGSSGKIVKAKEAIAKARAEREKKAANSGPSATQATAMTRPGSTAAAPAHLNQIKKPAYNSAQHTTGKAAASFTSTGLTPHTSNERAILTDEEYMLKPKRIKTKGYARLHTSHGPLTLELHPEFAPKTVWNFVQLAKRGYYNSTTFHRSIRNFMLQGGDPTGTGRGGTSIWNKPFADETDGPLKHDSRGTVSMANKGKNTNTSQFFITYRQTPHLDRKHTIFARVLPDGGGLDVLSRIESVATDDKDRPVDDVVIEQVVVFVDPFEEFLKSRAEKESREAADEEVRRQGGTEDDRTTWTGKRIRRDGVVGGDTDGAVAGVGKYLKAAIEEEKGREKGKNDVVVGGWGEGDDRELQQQQPVRKKVKKSAGGFGNFDCW
ncbi:peptidyl-prolyl cis-trans isomeras-like protein-like 2 [Pseudovirgaria hyperparasitica]|uniref:Peptidyl-prolyl cis-trans isomerase-like 2 n=1 Tax=Pseudovirgaria hyperparasitica TaxID=470096 RepID=A0A6A6W996_9PEZI|nr:peptidyl-prolyl cis-trans isomeras-like protein-like 2 [Pseudovirgaria hyperparasitica]KAF2759125.1 peptidyl-prolyl cis-trans isomeras-like protein-like 2 [Pseudovirgaria hyperparasitica]